MADSFPCADYVHVVDDLAVGSYDVDLKLPATSICMSTGPVHVGSGLTDLGPMFDLGPCQFQCACGGSVGCNDDGVCSTVDDDCICADCNPDPHCSHPLSCFDDGACQAYHEGCACVDCVAEPSCI